MAEDSRIIGEVASGRFERLLCIRSGPRNVCRIMNRVEGPFEAAAVVRAILRSRTPVAWRGRELPDHLRLGEEGLGLDSVSVVELLLDCEEALAISFPAELLDGPMTVGRLIDYAVRAASERAAT